MSLVKLRNVEITPGSAGAQPQAAYTVCPPPPPPNNGGGGNSGGGSSGACLNPIPVYCSVPDQYGNGGTTIEPCGFICS